MTDKIASLAIELSANIARFQSDMGRATRLAKKESMRMKKAMSAAMKAVAASAVAGAGSLSVLIKKTADAADEIQKMSNRLGISTEFLSQYRHVAELSGTSLGKVGDGLRKMSKSINDAENGLSTAVRAFDSLGLSVEQLKALKPEQQFELIADRISKVDEQSVKAGAAMDIFGRAGSELLTVLNAGSDGIAMMRKEADQFGLTISQNAADAAALFNDEITRLNAKFEGFSQRLSQQVLPTVTALVQELNSPGISESAEKFTLLNNTIATLFGAVKLVGVGFEIVGTAAGAAAAIAVSQWEAAVARIKNFGNDIKAIGLILLDALPVVDYGAEIEETLREGFKLEAIVREEAQKARVAMDQILTGSADDIEKATKDAFNSIFRVFNVANNGLKDIPKNTKKAGQAIVQNIVKPAKDSAKELSSIYREFESIEQSFETPLETINRRYEERIEVIGEYIKANKNSEESIKRAGELIDKLTDELIKNRKAIEDAIPPYQQLLDSLDEEIFALSATTEQLIQLDAARLLEQAGINRSNTALDEYTAKLEIAKEKLEEIASKQGTFGNSLNSFADLIKDAFSNGAGFFNSIKEGFASMTRDAQSFADGLGSINDFAAQISGFWQSTAGQDDAGRVLDTVNQIASTGVLGPVAQAISQVATFVDSLTGGRLFGTSFQLQSTTRQFDIGAGGGGGFVETLETRKRSLFRGTARRRIQRDLDADTSNVLDQLFENLQIAIQNSAIAVGGIAGDIITGSFVEEFDKDGNLVSQIATVLGRTYEESVEEFSRRITAENILAGISTIYEEAGDIANRWRHDAETLLDGAQFLLQAGADITAGIGLFESLTTINAVITDMQKPGESLVEAYTRVQGSVLQLDEAMGIMGQTLDVARAQYVRFAADITDAAGGIGQAASLWSSYFEAFYTEQELAAQALATATQTRDSLLIGIGLESSINVDEFRQLFESRLPELSADAVVEWLRAAEAIGVVIDLESDLVAERAENAAQLSTLISSINNEIENMGLSPFALRLKEIRQAFEENIATARQLGATERELALIQTHATRQINGAINALESDIGSALTDLYGTELDRINEQISLLEQQQGQIGSVANASSNRYQQELRAIQNIRRFVDDLFLNESLSPLNPLEQLNAAQMQFDTLLAAAQGGDVDALNQLPQVAQTLLGFGQDVFASSQSYVDIFDSVTSALSSLGVTSSPGGDHEQTIIGQNSQMIALLDERNRLEAAFDVQARLDAALAIAAQLSDLSSVTGESFTQLAQRLGIPVEQFLADLGVSLDNLTVETALALADTANLLGVEITDLAMSVGISLGDLADQNSLINDALEQTIAGLPTGIESQLEPLLAAIETATDPAQREALLEQVGNLINMLPTNIQGSLGPLLTAIETATDPSAREALLADFITAANALPAGIQSQLSSLLTAIETSTDATTREQLLQNFIDIANTLPEDQRNSLAPYFDQIDPITEAQQQVNHMAAIELSNQSIADGIDELRTQENTNNIRTSSAINNLADEQGEVANAINNLVNVLQATGTGGNGFIP